MNSSKDRRQNRKRKLSEEPIEIVEEIEYITPQNKNRVFDENAQKEEEELSKDLFGDNLGFLESLEDVEFLAGSSKHDSGVGETDSSNDETDKKPAWTDEDDDGIDVKSALDAQNRKLVDGGVNEKSNKYSNLLKHKFNATHKAPKWAKLSKKEEVDSDEELLGTAGHLVKFKSVNLPSETLEFKKLRDLNAETYNEGPLITGVEFHRSSTVALVTGVSGITSLFAVDGKTNNKLHTISFERYQIECARFLNDTEALLGSNHSHIFSYDLMTAKTNRIYLPNGLTQCKKFEISPDKKIIAVVGKFGQIHLLSATSKELIGTLKQNSDVTALAFTPNGNLFGHSTEGEVTIFDISNRRVKHKWVDDGCLQGTTLDIAQNNLVATGSAQGVVNLYDMDSINNSNLPKPRKTIFNLTTAITSLKFNHTSEILGFASSDMSNSLRLLHVGSEKVFSNFPPFGTKLGRVNYVSFSPNSGFAAFANRKSIVNLYRLKHYNNY